jgi:Ig-like domain from next to BRCA1 gene
MAGKSSAPRRGRRKLSSAQVTAAATIIAAVIGGVFLLANTLLSTTPSTSSGPVPTASSLPAPSATGPLIPGDNSEFISDATFPDHSTVIVGKHFIKKWKIKNTGSALWVGRYLAPIGTSTGKCTYPSRVRIPTTRQGQSVIISVPVTASSTPGLCYVTWKMVNATGALYFPNEIGIWFNVNIVKSSRR